MKDQDYTDGPGQEKTKTYGLRSKTLGFGKIFTDHFFTMKYTAGRGWYDAQIEPYRPLMLDPAAMALHYGQEIFEGLKAYRWGGRSHLPLPARRQSQATERLGEESLYARGRRGRDVGGDEATGHFSKKIGSPEEGEPPCTYVRP